MSRPCARRPDWRRRLLGGARRYGAGPTPKPDTCTAGCAVRQALGAIPGERAEAYRVKRLWSEEFRHGDECPDDLARVDPGPGRCAYRSDRATSSRVVRSSSSSNPPEASSTTSADATVARRRS